MKTLKTLALLLALLLAMLLAVPMLTACHDDDDNEVEPPVVGAVNKSDLIGKWQCMSFKVNGKDVGMTGATLTFNADGTYKSSLDFAVYFYDGGTYTFYDDHILILTSDDEQFTIIISIDLLNSKKFLWTCTEVYGAEFANIIYADFRRKK